MFGRRLGAIAFAALAVAGISTVATNASAAVPFTIKVSGHNLVNGAGHVVQLRGVDVTSTESVCSISTVIYPAPYSDRSLTTEASQIAVWHANVVRIPLNEDCWLGLNGQPSSPGGKPSTYRSDMEAFVKAINAKHMYAILDLDWTANGTAISDGRRQMPDDHSTLFWKSVATAFKTNHAVLFDAFSAPTGYSATQAANNKSIPVSWSCWLSGGCTVSNTSQAYLQKFSHTNVYKAVGMQAIVTTIRKAGATQPILLSGLNSGNDLSEWLGHEPKDTLKSPQLVAAFHMYQGESCSGPTCWAKTLLPIAKKVPVVDTEFGQTSCANPGLDTTWMKWGDKYHVGYVAWAFTAADGPPSPVCGTSDYAPVLLATPNPATAVPESTNGIQVYNHLRSFPAP